MNSHAYLVVEPIAIIAEDLAMNVQDYDPCATVLVARSVTAACEIVQRHPAVRLAFVKTDPESFPSTCLARALGARGTKLVFTGDAAERNARGNLVLQRPFCGQSTAAVLDCATKSNDA